MISKEQQDKLKNRYIGMTNTNYQGYEMKIIEYIKGIDIVVQFNDKDKSTRHCTVGNFKKGVVANPNHPTVYGVGIVDVNRKHVGKEHEYIVWAHMLRRCYIDDEHRNKRDSTYKDCVVCEEWKRYSNFYKWIHSQENYKKWENGNFSIDKDIIKKGNKLYCPEYCCLVPCYINNIFTKHTAQRGKYPIGVAINEYGTFTVALRDYDTNKYIHYGNFKTPEEAFYFYKKKKEEYIQKVAQEEFSQGNIIKRCYDAMMNYKVEITD